MFQFWLSRTWPENATTSFRTDTVGFAAVPGNDPVETLRIAFLKRIFSYPVEFAGESIRSGMWAT